MTAMRNLTEMVLRPFPTGSRDLLAITKELTGVVLPSTTSCQASDSLGRLAILQTAGNC